jgi:hypothetical protein
MQRRSPSKIPVAPLEQLDDESLEELLTRGRSSPLVTPYLLIRTRKLMANAQSKENGNEEPGIEETIDILDAAEETALKIIEEVLDGVDPMDAVQVVLDGDVRDSWAKAAQGASQIDEEVADLSSQEAFDLVRKSTDVGESIFEKVTS